MALQLQAFAGITDAIWQAFKAKILHDTGVQITANTGTVTHGSFVFTYDYNSMAELLQIQCLKKPLFIPASTITNGIAQEIAELRTAPVAPPSA